MSDLTREEVKAELKALDNRTTVKLLLVVLALKFQLPNEVTVPAVAAMFAKSGWALVSGRTN